MGIALRAAKYGFIQQGALGMADQLDAASIYASILKALTDLLDLLRASLPQVRAVVYRSALA
ncbi:hypothetical protein D3C86_2073460 [compost metagenome]